MANASSPLVLYAVSRTGADLGVRPASAAVSIKYSALDLTDSFSMITLASHVKEDHGGCDVLINNAGLYHYAQNPTSEQRREMVDINYRGTLMVYAFLRYCWLDLRRGKVFIKYWQFAASPIEW